MRTLLIPDSAKWLFETRVRFIPGLKVVYVVNPKVASSSVLASLWKAHDALIERKTFAGTPHDLDSSPFVSRPADLWESVEHLRSLPFFSIVRNPYARFVSAYLDKVARRSDVIVWNNVRRTVGLPEDWSPNLSTFIAAVEASDPMTLDWHFCPQHVNLMASFLSLDAVFRMECMGEVESFLNRQGIKLESFLPNPRHATGGAKLAKELMEPRDAESILRFYEKDFTLYGYSDDPTLVG